MSAHEHRKHAPKGPVACRVLVVSSSRSAEEDTSGAHIEALLGEAGHDVISREVVPDERAAIQKTVRAYASDGRTRALVITGGTGVSRTDVTPEAVRPLLTTELPGFGELFRMRSWEQVGPAAMLSRAFAGLAGPLLVFALPGSKKACDLAVSELIVPELPHLVHQVAREGTAAVPEPEEAEVEVVEDEDEAPEAPPRPPAPTGQFGGQAQNAVQLDTAAPDLEERPPSDEAVPASGWKRAVYDLDAEVITTTREDLPQPIETLAPVLNVLHTAGEQAVLKLPNGRKYSLWGFPDLQRPGSKVLAVGWGGPLAEVLALHRHPVQTGTCIDSARGLCPQRPGHIGDVAEAITGRRPGDEDGALFAVEGDAVYIQRDNTVYKWDGRREQNAGNPKQALASLVLGWSNR